LHHFPRLGQTRIWQCLRDPARRAADKRAEGTTMFARISLIWNGVAMMDVALAVMSCITIVALYAAFLM